MTHKDKWDKWKIPALIACGVGGSITLLSIFGVNVVTAGDRILAIEEFVETEPVRLDSIFEPISRQLNISNNKLDRLVYNSDIGACRQRRSARPGWSRERAWAFCVDSIPLP